MRQKYGKGAAAYKPGERGWRAGLVFGRRAAATEDTFFELAEHLPVEAAEALLQCATGGTLPMEASSPVANPYAHPDEEELFQALEYPWARWSVFLHPSQRAVVDATVCGARPRRRPFGSTG